MNSTNIAKALSFSNASRAYTQHKNDFDLRPLGINEADIICFLLNEDQHSLLRNSFREHLIGIIDTFNKKQEEEVKAKFQDEESEDEQINADEIKRMLEAAIAERSLDFEAKKYLATMWILGFAEASSQFFSPNKIITRY